MFEEIYGIPVTLREDRAQAGEPTHDNKTSASSTAN